MKHTIESPSVTNFRLADTLPLAILSAIFGVISLVEPLAMLVSVTFALGWIGELLFAVFVED